MEYREIDGYIELLISCKGQWYIVSIDREDFDRLDDYHVNVILTARGKVPYVRIQHKKNSVERYYLHRWLINAPSTNQVDHRDRNTLNCRKGNLRLVTNAQNSQNTAAHCDSKSGIRGVSWSEQKQKWRGAVYVEGHQYHAGFFTDLIEAESAVKSLRASLMPFSEEGGM